MRTIISTISSFIFLITLSSGLIAQPLTGTKTVGGASPDYATLSSAIDALNANGVGIGGVVFNIASGHTEVMANKVISTTTGAVGSEIIFQKNGSGANPLITAGAGTSTTLDGILKIGGTDYLTIDGIDLQEASTNTTTTTQMEWGIAILKGSATNGSQHISITNCNITLLRSNVNTKGIYIANHLTTATTALTVTASSGTNSFIDLNGNTINNSFSGIYTLGATNATYYDDSLRVGNTQRNTITNFGGSSTSYGIYLQNFSYAEVINDSIYNDITPTTTSTYYGIYTGNASNSSVLIRDNSLQLRINGSQSTRAVYGIYCLNGIAGNFINIQDNRIQNCLYGASSTLFSMIYTSSNADIIISGNTISRNERIGTSGQTSYIYSVLNPANRNISGNVIYGNKASGTSAKLYAVYIASGGGDIYDNVITYDSISGTSALAHQIYCPTGGQNIYRNNLSFNYSSGTSADGYVIFIGGAGAAPTLVYENNLEGNNHASSTTGLFHNLHIGGGSAKVYKNVILGSTTGGGNMTGINLASTSGEDLEVFQNKIYGFSSTNNSCIVSGILQNGLSNATLHNNIIGGIASGPTSSTTNAINGINVSSTTDGTSTNIFHNSIYISSASSGGSNCILLSTVSQVNLSNNILINASVAGTAAARAACAIRRLNTTYASYSAQSNNNFLSVGPAAGLYRYFYYDGTNAFQTLPAYQAYAANKDQSSITGSYYFLNTNASSIDFLKPDSVIPSFFESSGKMISGIEADFTRDQVRTGYPLTGQVNGGGTLPDLGAFEMDLIPNDSTGPEIVFTPIGKSLASFYRELNDVMITDKSGINQTSGRIPRLYFKKSTHSNSLASANNASADGWKYVETNSSSSPYNFLIDYALLYGSGSVSSGDIIQYFVVAEDNSIAHNTSAKGALLANVPNAVSLTSASFPVTINYSYQIFSSGLPSMITVADTLADYNSLTRVGGLFEAINNGLVASDINVLITGDLSNETGAVPLNKFSEDGFGAGTFKITIQPGNMQMYCISGSVATGGMIRILDAERVYFDGSYLGSGTYLSFVNRSVSSNVSVFHISGVSLGCKDIGIKNCIISMDTGYAIGTVGIFVGGTTVGTGAAAPAGFNNKRIYLDGNNISQAYYGILVNGMPSYPADSIEMKNNEIGSDTLSKYIVAYGIYLRGITNSNVFKNHIYNISNPNTFDLVGIRVMQDVYRVNFYANRIHNIINTGAGSSGVFGIYVQGNPSSNLVFKNNIIYRILGQGNASDIFAGPVGLLINTGSHYKVFNNAIVLSGNRLNNAVGSAYTSCLFVRANSSNVEVMNNVFKNVMTSSNTVHPGSNFAIFTNTANVSAYTALNHNCYMVGSSTPGLVSALAYAGSVKADLQTWRSFSGKDQNSLWGEPGYLNDTLLEINLSDSNSWHLIGRGMPLTDVEEDGNGNSRSIVLQTGASDIGAISFAPSVSPRIAQQSATPATGTTTYYTVAQDTVAAIIWSATSLMPTSIGVKYYSGTNPAATTTNSFLNAYWEIEAVPATGYDFSLRLYYKPESMRTIENESSLVMAQRSAPSTWAPYIFGLTLVDSVRKFMLVENLSSFATYTGTSISNPLPVELTSFTATRVNENIVLKWTSASEVNVANYQPQRSTNGMDNWEVLEEVKANGNSTRQINYACTDRNGVDILQQTGVLYYRLLITDFDGSRRFSPVVILDKVPASPSQIPVIWPNPFEDRLEISVANEAAIDARLLDMNGREILNFGHIRADKNGMWKISGMAELPNGVYILNIHIDGVPFHKKIMKR